MALLNKYLRPRGTRKKSWRRPYPPLKERDSSCRNHRGCPQCLGNHQSATRRAHERLEWELADWFRLSDEGRQGYNYDISDYYK